MAAPQSTILKQRVALAATQDRSTLVFITIEWLQILRQLEQQIAAAAGGTPTPPFDPSEILIELENNAMHIAELQAQMVEVHRRLDALEGGFER